MLMNTTTHETNRLTYQEPRESESCRLVLGRYMYCLDVGAGSAIMDRALTRRSHLLESGQTEESSLRPAPMKSSFTTPPEEEQQHIPLPLTSPNSEREDGASLD